MGLGNGQCRINHGAGGAHAPGPLSSGATKFFKVIFFIHMKYTKNQFLDFYSTDLEDLSLPEYLHSSSLFDFTCDKLYW